MRDYYWVDRRMYVWHAPLCGYRPLAMRYACCLSRVFVSLCIVRYVFAFCVHCCRASFEKDAVIVTIKRAGQ